MKRGHLLPAITAAVAISALGLGLTISALQAAASAAHTAARTPLYSEQPVVFDCPGVPKPSVRPNAYILTCADDGDYFTGLHWTSWGPGLASATGTQRVNDCTPFCYDGHFHSYPVDLVFWGGAAVAGHPGEQRYTEATALYPGTRPPTYQKGKPVEGPMTVTWQLPTGDPRHWDPQA